MKPIGNINRKKKEREFSLGLIAIGLCSVSYGLWNYWLWTSLQHVINLTWFLLFDLLGIILTSLGAVYAVLSYSYFNRINKINKSLK